MAQETRSISDAVAYKDVDVTVDALTDSGSVIDSATYDSLAIILSNTDAANSLNWLVLASIDGITYVTVSASATLATGEAGSFVASTASYRYYKVQTQSAVAATPATFEASFLIK